MRRSRKSLAGREYRGEEFRSGGQEMPETGKTRRGKVSTETADRRAKALELRRAGLGYAEIARQIGVSGPGAAYKIVRDALKATYQEPADDVRKLELDRLDRLQLAMWKRALGGKDPAGNPVPPDYEAVDRLFKIMKHRAELLGLKAPTVIEQSIKSYEVGNAPEDL
jgi:hypothetical protein